MMKWTVLLLLLCAGLSASLNDENPTEDAVKTVISILLKCFLKVVRGEVALFVQQFGRELHIYGSISSWIKQRNVKSLASEVLISIDAGSFGEEGLNMKQKDHFYIALQELYEYTEELDQSLGNRGINYSEVVDLVTNSPVVKRPVCHNSYDDLYQSFKVLNKEYHLPSREVFAIGCHLMKDFMKPLPNFTAVRSELIPGNKENAKIFYNDMFKDKVESLLTSIEHDKNRDPTIKLIQYLLIAMNFFRNSIVATLYDCFYEPVPFSLIPIPGNLPYDVDLDPENLKIFEHLIDLAELAEETICPAIKNFVDKEYPNLDPSSQLNMLIPKYFANLDHHVNVPIEIEAAERVAVLMLVELDARSPGECLLTHLCLLGLSTRKQSELTGADILIGRLISYDMFPHSSQLKFFKGFMESKAALGSRAMTQAVWDGKLGDCSKYPKEACDREDPERESFDSRKTEL